MTNRWKDWWDQAARGARHAQHAVEDGDYEWSAFAAQQAAEEALKAFIMTRGGEPGATRSRNSSRPPRGRRGAAGSDRSREPCRQALHPGALSKRVRVGYPGKLYTRGEAEGAIADAEKILEFCRRRLP